MNEILIRRAVTSINNEVISRWQRR